MNSYSCESSVKLAMYRILQLCIVLDDTVDAIHESLCCIRSLADQNWSTKSQSMVNYALLHGINSNQHSDNLARNLRNLIVDIKSILKKDNFQNVFLYIVVKSKSFDPMVNANFYLR